MSGARLSRQWLVLSVFPEINVKASGTRRWQKGLQCFKFAAKIDKLTMPHARASNGRSQSTKPAQNGGAPVPCQADIRRPNLKES